MASGGEDGVRSGPVGDPTDSEVVPVDPEAEEQWPRGADQLTSDPVTLRKLLAAKDLTAHVEKRARTSVTTTRTTVTQTAHHVASGTTTVLRRAGARLVDLTKRAHARIGAAWERWRATRDDVE